MDPSRSDVWNCLPHCKGNAELAHQIASIIIGFSPTKKGTDTEDFWRNSEIAALAAILLHLPQIINEPSPAMINELISLRSINHAEGESESPLTKEMINSPDPQVEVYWGAFTKAKRDLQGSILTGVISKWQAFTDARALLAHLNLVDNGKPTNAAILLFGSNPQRFHRPAATKCIHCHGTISEALCFLAGVRRRCLRAGRSSTRFRAR
jgi:hypothetical protein